MRSTKAKSYRREAALAAVAAKRLELAMADEAYHEAEKARKDATEMRIAKSQADYK